MRGIWLSWLGSQMTQWIEEYFYYGHGEGHGVRHADGVFQEKIEQEVMAFRVYPDIDDPENLELLNSYVETYPQMVDLHIYWVIYTGKVKRSSAWVVGWVEIDEDAYLKCKEAAWANPDGSYSVPDFDNKDKIDGRIYPSI